MQGLPRLADAAWFACLGLPLTASERSDARAYLDALGYPHASIQTVASWREAERAARDPNWDTQWWAREDGERERLMQRARERLGSAALLDRLSAATELATEVIHGAAARAAERDGIADAALTRAASGAASMALHTAALSRLAGEGGAHLFMRKYALFEAGRWPLGIVSGAFFVF
jgi:hypothetical protein